MISVIVPTLNAGADLARCFDSLIGAAVSGLVREVIVADGGSADDTLPIADAAGARVVKAGKSRAAQLNAGAQAAKCDWLLFLHPTVTLEASWTSDVEAFVDRHELGQPEAALFPLAVERMGYRARWHELAASLRFTLFGLPRGEQGLLMSRHFFQAVGGYHELPALEDLDMARRIGRRRLVRLRARALVSSTRFPHAFAATLLSVMKVPMRIVARIYH